MRFLTPIFLACFSILLNVDSKGADMLDSDVGKPIQIRIEFTISEYEENGKGGFSLLAHGHEDGEEVGFKFTLLEDWKIGLLKTQGSKKKTLEVKENAATFETIGAPSLNLENLIKEQLQTNYDTTLCAGIFKVSAPLGYCSDSSISHYSLHNVIAASYHLSLILDIPFEKLILYASVPGGYGGYDPVNKARHDRIDSANMVGEAIGTRRAAPPTDTSL